MICWEFSASCQAVKPATTTSVAISDHQGTSGFGWSRGTAASSCVRACSVEEVLSGGGTSSSRRWSQNSRMPCGQADGSSRTTTKTRAMASGTEMISIGMSENRLASSSGSPASSQAMTSTDGTRVMAAKIVPGSRTRPGWPRPARGPNRPRRPCVDGSGDSADSGGCGDSCDCGDSWDCGDCGLTAAVVAGVASVADSADSAAGSADLAAGSADAAPASSGSDVSACDDPAWPAGSERSPASAPLLDARSPRGTDLL